MSNLKANFRIFRQDNFNKFKVIYISMFSGPYMDRLFTNLKVLSKVEPNQKLYTRDSFLVADDGDPYSQALFRWWYNENRELTLTKVQEVVRSTVSCGQHAINCELIKTRDTDLDARKKAEARIWEADKDKILQMDNRSLLECLTKEMDAALVGIRNLKKTYHEDRTLSSKFELEIEFLERNIEKFRKFLKI